MENQQNHSAKGISDERRKKLALSALVLEKYFKKWTQLFPNQVSGAVALAIYLEALDDLTADELEIGCREATRDADQFPKPGHIRHALEAFEESEPHPHDPRIFSGPPRPAYLNEPCNADNPEWKRLAGPVAAGLTMPPGWAPEPTKIKPKVTLVERTPEVEARLKQMKEDARARGYLK